MALTKQDIEKIKRLPPKERLKKIKELKKKREEERKKSEEEEKRLMSESIKEMELDKMLQEIEVPTLEEVKVGDLFEKEQDIEEKIEAEKIQIQEQGGEDYGARIGETLNKVQAWRYDGTRPTQQEWQEAYENINQEYETLKQQINEKPVSEHYQTESEERLGELVESKRMLKNMGYKH